MADRSSIRRRWRLAFLSVRCSRVLISLYQEVNAAKKNQLQQRQQQQNAMRRVRTKIICSVAFLQLHSLVKKKAHLGVQSTSSGSYRVIDIPPPASPYINLDPAKLKALVKEKNLNSLEVDFGGVDGLVRALRSSSEAGILSDRDDLNSRIRYFGSNDLYRNTPSKWVQIFPLKMIAAGCLFPMFVCVVIYAVSNIFPDGLNIKWWNIFPDGLNINGWWNIFQDGTLDINAWIGGFAMFYLMESAKSPKPGDEVVYFGGCFTEVVRDGTRKKILISQIVVGDVVCLKRGDLVPADGLFLDGQSLKVLDESSGLTREVKSGLNSTPWLFSTTRVIDGHAQMLVTAVGRNTKWGSEKSKSLISCHSNQAMAPLCDQVHNSIWFWSKLQRVTAFYILPVAFALVGDKHFQIFLALAQFVFTTFPSVDNNSTQTVRKITLEHFFEHLVNKKIMVGDPSCYEIACVATAIVIDEMGILEGLKGQCQSTVRKSVEEWRNAGVDIKMVTVDSIPHARVTATAIGLLEEDFNSNADQSVVIEGEAFRNYTPEEKKLKIDGIRVMAASSTSDKVDFLGGLKQRGRVVAVINNTGTSDTTTALKEAHICISMGIVSNNQGEEEKFDIIDSLNMVFTRGRRIRSNIQKSIQFQFTAYIVSLISFFVALVANPSVDRQSPVLIQELFFQSCQVLFSNVVLQILSPVVFGMDEDEDEDEQVIESLIITNVMWRNIAAQAAYQIVMTQILQFHGQSIFGANEKANNTMAFAVSILCLVFNLFNARKIESKNIFKGAHKNRYLMGAVAIIVFVLVMLVEVISPKLMGMEKLDWKQWMACFGVGFASWTMGLAFKFVPVPDKPFKSYFLCLETFVPGWLSFFTWFLTEAFDILLQFIRLFLHVLGTFDALGLPIALALFLSLFSTIFYFLLLFVVILVYVYIFYFDVIVYFVYLYFGRVCGHFSRTLRNRLEV